MIRSTPRTLLPLLALLTWCLPSHPALGGPMSYSITDLGTLPGASRSLVYGLNNLGQVVGTSDDAGFLYSGGSGITSLGAGRSPLAINDSGTVTYRSTDFISQGVNASGEMIGYRSDDSFRDQPVTMTNGVVTPIPLPNGGTVTGINDSGDVVGSMRVYSYGGTPEMHPYLYSHGKLTDLGLPRNTTIASALAINNAGQVVGGSNGPRGDAFLYQDGKTTYLGTLGGGSSLAGAINESGQIVGTSDVAQGPGHSFLYQDGKMTDLTELIRATGGITTVGGGLLNDAGQIAIDGYLPGQTDIHAFLLTPQAVPEPATVLTFAAAGLVLIGRQARRVGGRKA
jgi:probable HAF family extracellular repeat protein